MPALQKILLVLAGIALAGTGVAVGKSLASRPAPAADIEIAAESREHPGMTDAELAAHLGGEAGRDNAAATGTPAAAVPAPKVQATLSAGQKALSRADLLALASDAYASGELPLGDYRYTTDAPKKGYIYLCNARKDNPGSMTDGPWMHGTTWNMNQKYSVDGEVSWPQATFSNIVSGAYRVLTGNMLPVSHTTGVFPVAKSDDAALIDPNPNAISAQTMKYSLPAEPTYSETPYCMGGEVGVMLSGVPLFNGFDAGLRDAAAHEVQDGCEGHPQGSGQYHYHSLSSCFKDASVETVLGYAYDGFPITGAVVEKGKYLTTEDLDVCHGLTSEIVVDGRRATSYHYVMTMDFPYSASCFRGKAVSTSPGQQAGQAQPAAQRGQQMQGGTPPQQAVSACSGKASGAPCSFTGDWGEAVSGVCGSVQGGAFACVPSR